MDSYVARKPDPTIELRRKRLKEKVERINALPGWKLDLNYIQTLPIRKAEEAVECVFFVDED